MQKKFKEAACVMFLISILLSLFGCSDISYQEYGIGENFGHNRDGHYKKLPQNYCIEVLLGDAATVFIVPASKSNVPFFTKSVYNQAPVVKGHYIMGWFNDNYLVLCEEKPDSSCAYFSLEFGSNIVTYYDNVNSIYDEFGFGVQDWFLLCNSNKDRLR